ncbi:DNA cytosine methyltransferase [Geobacillus subterraneus]|uniref:DNA cytosine methyltransferase n=1 Tax=Geobacillus subterraneus TaxID=129338 RepID=UPI001FCAE5F7|nr:DNA cytosine methyltransferase [Geobacillus subterraneus]
MSLFSGAGGLDLGMKQAGFHIRLCVDNDPVCCQTLRQNNLSSRVWQADLSALRGQDIRALAELSPSDPIDLLFGGSPCQSFSFAGKRKGFDDERGQLLLHFFQLVQELQPKSFLLENVKGLLFALRNEPDITSYFSRFAPSYRVHAALLNVADYGVPQKRERVFVVGIHQTVSRRYQFPAPTHQREGKGGKRKWVSVQEAFSLVPIHQHHFIPYRPSQARWMKQIPKGGGNWRDLYVFGEDVVKQAMGKAFFFDGRTNGLLETDSSGSTRPHVVDVSFA